MLIYKILTLDEWISFQQSGIYCGSAVDLKDGFIHFSKKEQTIETASKHFSGQTNLILLAVDETFFGDHLIYESSRGGQLFPHLYSSLLIDAVKGSAIFNSSADGLFQFPQEFE